MIYSVISVQTLLTPYYKSKFQTQTQTQPQIDSASHPQSLIQSTFPSPFYFLQPQPDRARLPPPRRLLTHNKHGPDGGGTRVEDEEFAAGCVFWEDEGCGA